MEPKQITIIGCGPGAIELVTPAATAAARAADVLAGTGRLFDLFPDCTADRIGLDNGIDYFLNEMKAQQEGGKSVAVLVTGDPGYFSLARRVRAFFGKENCNTIPGISSLQYGCSVAGFSWQEFITIYAHGVTPDKSPSKFDKSCNYAILCGGSQSMEWITGFCREVDASHTAVLCRDLSLKTECVIYGTPDEVSGQVSGKREIILLKQKEEK